MIVKERVCDRCYKVIRDNEKYYETKVTEVCINTDHVTLDLCENCYQDFTQFIKEQK